MGREDVAHSKNCVSKESLANARGFNDGEERVDHALEIHVRPDVHTQRRRRLSIQQSSGSDHDLPASCFLHTVLEGCHLLADVHNESERSQQKQNREQSYEVPRDDRSSSRLSKSELGELALGIRELGKKLSAVRLEVKVQKILIVTKAHDDAVVRKTHQLVSWLLSEKHNYSTIVYVTV